ncbi:MAG: 16S rRNA (adenine(1518)-N(6)/adenine(1519)-N(6))-dimethyltransferase RsmA [Nitrospirota bacterium]|nr:16S rRNA (adenine(1518)-N(6)/adenine(1519)-N(6))-dimethyltransferase RsmA [Nitrospirota bacterium]
MTSPLPDGHPQWRPSKALGQNFLVDHGAVRRIVEAAEVDQEDTVLEIGPGKGVLTAALAEKAGQVVALEFDRHLAESLMSDFSGADNVRIIYADALEFPLETLPHPLKVVANLPYSVATPILFRLLENRHCLSRMVLMFQKEVAERILAEPGGRDYGVLSVMVQAFTRPKLEFVLPPDAFRPRPKIDSAVVSFETPSVPRVALVDENAFRRVVKAAFSQRRKTLRNSLKALLGERVEEVLLTVGIDPMRRAETLTLEEFARLSVASR